VTAERLNHLVMQRAPLRRGREILRVTGVDHAGVWVTPAQPIGALRLRARPDVLPLSLALTELEELRRGEPTDCPATCRGDCDACRS